VIRFACGVESLWFREKKKFLSRDFLLRFAPAERFLHASSANFDVRWRDHGQARLFGDLHTA